MPTNQRFVGIAFKADVFLTTQLELNIAKTIMECKFQIDCY